MLKHYCIWQLKKWLPLLGIFGGALTLVFGYTCLEAATATIASGSGAYATYGYGPSFLAIFIPAMLLTFVMAVFVYAYRTSRQSVDTYYQAAYKSTTIKRARTLIGLGILLASITIAFIIGFAIYGIRYLSTPLTREVTMHGNPYTYVRIDYNFGLFGVAYLLLLLFVTAEYFINCFLASLGSYVFDQICLLLFGNVFLSLCILGPALYIITVGHIQVAGAEFSLLYGFGPIGPCILSYFISLPGFSADYEIFPHLVGTSVLTVSLGIICTIANFFIGDPTGETANVRGARNKTIGLIPHGAALAIGLVVGCCGLLPNSTNYVLSALPWFIYGIFGIGYYGFLALWRHSFKPSKEDLICFLSVYGATLLLMIACTISWQGGAYLA